MLCTLSWSGTQASHKLGAVLVRLPLECWEYRHLPPNLAPDLAQHSEIKDSFIFTGTFLKYSATLQEVSGPL